LLSISPALIGQVAVHFAQAAEQPKILFIISDDHAYQAVSCYDGTRNHTPNIDRIAKEGIRFNRLRRS
jgi:arylsulfatase A-like enzyme